MIAEILATGQEIITGAAVDSNSAHIAEALETVGLEVTRHTCIGDDMDRLVAVLREIGARADVAVVTGGLGPTTDDLTAEAAAKAAGVALVLNPEAWRAVEDAFRSRRRFMSPSNRKQAMLPQSAQCLFNPVGTAPGFRMKIQKCLFFFLPGVPFEMRRMVSDAVVPQVRTMPGGDARARRVKTVSIFGLTEAATGELVAGLTAEFPEIKLGIRAKFPEIQVKLYGSSSDEDRLAGQLEKAAATVLEAVGQRAFSVDGRSMEALIGDLLRREKATLAVAESCTAGLVSHMLTNVPGSSDYFLFGGVTYADDAKKTVLGVSAETLERFGAVHEETAREMAAGARRLAGATYGLATSGIAGPDGGTDLKPVGTVCIGLAAENFTRGFRFNFPFGDRLMKKKIFAMAALDILRQKLLQFI